MQTTSFFHTYNNFFNNLYMNNNFFQKSLCSLVIVGKALLKLVFLEWSGSKSDIKFGFICWQNHPEQVFGSIGATSGVWQHIAIFAWQWHAQVIFNPSTIELYIKNLKFIVVYSIFTFFRKIPLQYHLTPS